MKVKKETVLKVAGGTAKLILSISVGGVITKVLNVGLPEDKRAAMRALDYIGIYAISGYLTSKVCDHAVTEFKKDLAAFKSNQEIVYVDPEETNETESGEEA